MSVQSSQTKIPLDEGKIKLNTLAQYLWPLSSSDDEHNGYNSSKTYRHRRGSSNGQSHLSEMCDGWLGMDCLSCKGYCGNISEFIYTKQNRPCSCDSHCVAFGDCCLDFAKVCPHHQPTLQEQQQQLPPMICVSHKAPIIGIYNRMFVSACISGEACPYIFDRITDKVDSYTRPVLDSTTGFHYVNYACAICNKAADIIPWQVSSTRLWPELKSVKYYPD